MWPDNLSNVAVLLCPELDDIMKGTFHYDSRIVCLQFPNLMETIFKIRDSDVTTIGAGRAVPPPLFETTASSVSTHDLSRVSVSY